VPFPGPRCPGAEHVLMMSLINPTQADANRGRYFGCCSDDEKFPRSSIVRSMFICSMVLGLTAPALVFPEILVVGPGPRCEAELSGRSWNNEALAKPFC